MAGKETKAWRRPQQSAQRIAEILRYPRLVVRGVPFTGDPAADLRRCLIALVWHLSKEEDRIQWIASRYLGLTGCKMSEGAAAEIVDEADARDRLPLKADPLGQYLGLKYYYRDGLKIHTIGACDATKADRLKLARVRRKTRSVNVGDGGDRGRDPGRRHSLPWRNLGISRRTYYRLNRKANESP